MKPFVRPAVESDLDRINDIYNEYIVDSHVSFDLEAWTIEDRQRWWHRYADGRFPALVAEIDGEVVGVTYAGPYKDKAGYAGSVETTVALDSQHHGQGIGRLLLTALLESLAASGVHRAYAFVALPNEPSVALHERLGYRRVGVLDEVGYKMGEYRSTMLLEKRFE